MKRHILSKTRELFHFIVYILLPLGGGWVGVSCSDMLETESTRQNIEPELTAKTDSLFYGFGILQAMQQLADQYVLQGELRGELVSTTKYTDNNLRQLANFSATTANQYDSAYVYYRVINNCNYYIAHRDTTLLTGSRNVVLPEYAAVKAIRAWAYLQLGRNYERVPFFTEPLTQISQIDGGNYPELDLKGLVSQLAPDLEQYTGFTPPSYGLSYNGFRTIGSPNWASETKSFSPMRCFIPVDVILGELYLEAGQFEQAARHYIIYLTQVASSFTSLRSLFMSSDYVAPMSSKSISNGRIGGMTDSDLPDRGLLSTQENFGTSWDNIFDNNSAFDIISYIPMAVNRQNGTITQLPLIFGFNYYATNEELATSGSSVSELSGPYVEEVQLLPSATLNMLSDSTEYYFYFDNKTNDVYDSIQSYPAGDMRLRSIMSQTLREDSTMQWIDKYKYANIIL